MYTIFGQMFMNIFLKLALFWFQFNFALMSDTKSLNMFQ